MMLHLPVMAEEVSRFVRKEGILVDATVGTAGHTLYLLSRYPALRAICVDRDLESLEMARQRLGDYLWRVEFIHGDYRSLPSLELPWEEISSVLVDMGISSFQLSSPRGFSFQRDGELDMRFDRSKGEPAREFLKKIPYSDLVLLFRNYSDLRRAESLAREIKKSRPQTTSQMVDVVKRVYGKAGPELLARVFQAIRIGVNRELEGIGEFILALAERLSPGARLIFLTYHSAEDRLVKNALKKSFSMGLLKNLTPKVLRPSAREIEENPRARSAKMRVAEK